VGGLDIVVQFIKNGVARRISFCFVLFFIVKTKKNMLSYSILHYQIIIYI